MHDPFSFLGKEMVGAITEAAEPQPMQQNKKLIQSPGSLLVVIFGSRYIY